MEKLSQLAHSDGPKAQNSFLKEVRGTCCWIRVLNFLIYIIPIYSSREQTSQREQLNFQDFPRITAWNEQQKQVFGFAVDILLGERLQPLPAGRLEVI